MGEGVEAGEAGGGGEAGEGGEGGEGVGVQEGNEGQKEKKKNGAKLHVGQYGPSMWRENMEIANPMRDGLSAYFLI
jgi:actin-like protein 6B